MSLKINAKTTEETLNEKLGQDGEIIEGAAALLSFAATAAAGEPTGTAAGIIGAAAARQLTRFESSGKQERFFLVEPFKGAFWRCLCILASGGITLDEILANRLLDGVRVVPAKKSAPINDLESPLKLAYLSRAEGIKHNIADQLIRCLRYTSQLERTLLTLQVMLRVVAEPRRSLERQERPLLEGREIRMFSMRRERNPVREMIGILIENGLVPSGIEPEVEQYEPLPGQ